MRYAGTWIIAREPTRVLESAIGVAAEALEVEMLLRFPRSY